MLGAGRTAQTGMNRPRAGALPAHTSRCRPSQWESKGQSELDRLVCLVTWGADHEQRHDEGGADLPDLPGLVQRGSRDRLRPCLLLPLPAAGHPLRGRRRVSHTRARASTHITRARTSNAQSTAVATCTAGVQCNASAAPRRADADCLCRCRCCAQGSSLPVLPHPRPSGAPQPHASARGEQRPQRTRRRG